MNITSEGDNHKNKSSHSPIDNKFARYKTKGDNFADKKGEDSIQAQSWYHQKDDDSASYLTKDMQTFLETPQLRSDTDLIRQPGRVTRPEANR